MRYLVILFLVLFPISSVAIEQEQSFVFELPEKPKKATKQIGFFEFSGDFSQGGLIAADVSDDIKSFIKSIKHNDKKIKILDNKILLGFGRDDKLKNKLALNFTDGTSQEFDFKIAKRTYNTQRITGIDKKYVDPGKEFWARIKRENGIIGAKRKEIIDSCNLEESWQIPAEGIISGVYGSQRFFNGKAKRPHFGIDIAAAKGTPVIAPKSGKVTMVHQDMYYTGKTIIMNHGCGLISVFLHLDETLVKEGQQVAKGEVIGQVGSTGRSTGPHLDWRLNLFKTRLDPQMVLD